MLFSIIIPTCNRNELLWQCLKLLDQQIDSTDFEIIVTDDSNTNISKLFIENNFPTINWVLGPKMGPAANRNNGASFSNGEWLIFIDDDCLPDKNLLKNYSSAIANRKISQLVFEGKIIANREQCRFDEEAPINLNGGCLWSCNFCIEKTLFFSIGKFDEKFPYPSMEDADLNERLAKEHSILFLKDAVVIHPWRRIVFFSRFKHRLLSFRYFVRKHYSESFATFRISRMKIFIYCLFTDLILLIRFKFKGTLYYFEKSIFNFISIFL